MDQFDLVIVGAGVVGCVVAERAASQRGWRSLIIEKRNHIAGNCFDEYHESGLLIHKYGPHYFRTNKPEVLDYLSAFTDWIDGRYLVKSYSQDRYFQFPINLDTLEQFYNVSLTPDSGPGFLDDIRDRSITLPQNSEEFVLSRVGRRLYEAFYLGYTLKQWGRHPRDLDASVCGRIPVRFNRDPRYVDHRYQVTPKDGFTQMFAKMIARPEIKVMLNTDYDSLRSVLKPRVGTVYTGPLDQYFGFEQGRLPWRSLEFDFRWYPQEFRQPCVQINYPNDFAYTRTVEIKHVTQQVHPHTVVSYEYSRAQGDPYYPVPAAENRALYERYKAKGEAIARSQRIFFAGRLARYTYINTDEAIEMGLATFDDIVKRSGPA